MKSIEVAKQNYWNLQLRWRDDKIGMKSGDEAVPPTHSSQDTCKNFLYRLLVEYSWVVEIPRIVDLLGPGNQPPIQEIS